MDADALPSSTDLGLPLLVESADFSSDFPHVFEMNSTTGDYYNSTRAYDVSTQSRVKFSSPVDDAVEMPPYAMRINDVHIPDNMYVVQSEHHAISTTIPQRALDGHYYSMYPAVHRLRNARIVDESITDVRRRMLYRFIDSTVDDPWHLRWVHARQPGDSWVNYFDGILHPLSMAAVYDRVGEPAPGKFCANVLSSGGVVISNGTPPGALDLPTARYSMRVGITSVAHRIPWTATPANPLQSPHHGAASVHEPLTASLEFSGWDQALSGWSGYDMLGWTGLIHRWPQISSQPTQANVSTGLTLVAWNIIEDQWRYPTSTAPQAQKMLDPFEHSDSSLFSGCAYYKELYYRTHRDTVVPFLALNSDGNLIRLNPPANYHETREVLGKYNSPSDENQMQNVLNVVRSHVADTGLPLVDYDAIGESSTNRERVIRIRYVEPHAEELSHADFMIENYYIDVLNVAWVCDLCTDISITTDSSFLITPFHEYWDEEGNVIINRGNDHRGLVRDRLVYSGVVDPLTVSLGPEAPQEGGTLQFQTKTYPSLAGGRNVTLVYRRFAHIRSLFLPDPRVPSLYGINRVRWVYVDVELPPDFNLLINDSSVYTVVKQVINGWGDTVKYLNPAPSELLLFNRVGYTHASFRVYVTVSTKERYHESTPASDAVRGRFSHFSDIHPVRFSIQTYKFFKTFSREGVR